MGCDAMASAKSAARFGLELELELELERRVGEVDYFAVHPPSTVSKLPVQ